MDEKIKGKEKSNFEAKVRYLGTTLIVTVPMRVRRKLGLKPGDEVEVLFQKKEEPYLAGPRK